eukprot:TRINITY_DN17923_c0_g1_i1.p1 TRINITY_DN17923_c0_g1~~TRINITY_DN17923_c0_g1_i1.p1  ORF type:complete len:380 (-),score=85.54 TRINITY_DN17923_c0_g1_i1:53-1192(-)
MSPVRLRSSTGWWCCLLVARRIAALDQSTAGEVDDVVTHDDALAGAAYVGVSMGQNTSDSSAQLPGLRPPVEQEVLSLNPSAPVKAAPKSPTPNPGAKPQPPKPAGAKAPTSKPVAKSPTPKPGTKLKAKGANKQSPKKKAGPSMQDIALTMKRQGTSDDRKDAREAARMAHQLAVTAVKAARKHLKHFKKVTGGGKGKGKQLTMNACDKTDLVRKVGDSLTIARIDTWRKVLGLEEGCGRGRVPRAAMQAARAVLQAKIPGKIEGGQLIGRMGHLLSKQRKLREQVSKMKAWLSTGKKAGKGMAKKMKKRTKGKAMDKKSISVAAKAATAATFKALAKGLSRCKVQKISETAAARAIAMELLKRSGNEKGKGKKGKCK